jgi:3-hydroxyacyl-[acyl-carrier-protein] dehydratase
VLDCDQRISKVIGVNSVKDYIPHREPFLFVENIVEIDDDHIVTELTVREDFEFFAGHYPGNPIMPGVLMCEAVFQTAGIFMSKNTSAATESPQMPILTKISNARFKRMITPGEKIRIEVVPVETKGVFHVMRGKILNESSAMVMNVEFTITQK